MTFRTDDSALKTSLPGVNHEQATCMSQKIQLYRDSLTLTITIGYDFLIVL